MTTIRARAAESESSPELELVGVDRFLGVGVGAGVGKILPTPAGSRKTDPSTNDDLGRTVIHLPENIETQEERRVAMLR